VPTSDDMTGSAPRARRSASPRADVLFENMRPGKLAALGLGPEVRTALRPDLVLDDLGGHRGPVPGLGAAAAVRADWDPDLLRATCATGWPTSSETRRYSWSTTPSLEERHQVRRGAAPVLRDRGRIENCQIGGFLAYATPAGRTLLDRELYLPKSWTDDRERCAEAGISDEIGFAIKPELAEKMLRRALDADVPAVWVTGDEAYGQVSAPRRAISEHGVSYLLAVPSNQRVHAVGGGRSVLRSVEGELAGVEVEVLGGEPIEVGEGHEVAKERVPAGGVMHAAGEFGVGLGVEAAVQRGDDTVEQRDLGAGPEHGAAEVGAGIIRQVERGGRGVE
jgi:hypothetical protein